MWTDKIFVESWFLTQYYIIFRSNWNFVSIVPSLHNTKGLSGDHINFLWNSAAAVFPMSVFLRGKRFPNSRKVRSVRRFSSAGTFWKLKILFLQNNFPRTCLQSHITYCCIYWASWKYFEPAVEIMAHVLKNLEEFIVLFFFGTLWDISINLN